METDKEYTPIRVATLRGDMKIPFDVYIKVAGKYILYCRNGSSFEGERLARLRAKKLRKMYVAKADEIPYQQYLESNIDSAYANSDGKAMDIRAEVIQGFQQAAAEDYFEDPLDEFTYKHLRSSVQRFTEFIEREPAAAKAMLEIPNVDQSITHHGVTVATLGVALAIEAGLREGIQLNLFAMGCLLHDIDHFFTDTNVGRPLSQFSKEEMTAYREHPLNGAHRLQGAKFIDQIVLNVITQHEEHMDGSGSPKGLRDKDMDPLVLVAGLANAYDRLICFEGLQPKDALKELLIKKLGVYPLPHIQALQNVLKRLQIV
jgi:HD-GYP domain-containing protein (c-di-GMP phosphodiesterase class II)